MSYDYGLNSSPKNPGCAIIAGIFTIISFVIFVVGILAYLPTLFR